MNKQTLLVRIILVLILAGTSLSPADVPQLISFQGKLYDDTGNPLTGQHEMTFRIYAVESAGTALWSETDSVQCENGLYAVILGTSSPFNLNFDGQYWLGVQVSGDDELSPRYRLVSVPTAFRAQIANQVSWTDLTDVPAGFADGTDDVGETGGLSQINAGTGIEVTNPSGPTATVAVNFGPGSTQVAAGNHNHDADYVEEGQANAITADMIFNSAVTSEKIASNAVTSGKIQNSTVQKEDLAFTPSDITQISAGSGITVTNPTGPTVTVAAHFGPGSTQVAAGNHNHDEDYVKEGQADAIITDMIYDSAVTSEKIATNAVTSAKILDGTILMADLAFTTGGDGHSLDAADGSPTDALYVDNDGDVGIGTTSPTRRLVIDGESETYDACLELKAFWNPEIFFNQGGGAADAKIHFQDRGTEKWLFYHDGSEGSLKFNRSGSGTVLCLSSSAGVGIGTTGLSGYKLYVNGSLAVNSSTADKTGGGSWGTLSDGRLKTITGTFDYGLDHIQDLQPIRYRYKRNNELGLTSGTEHIGFIAQDIEKVIPEAVREGEQGYLIVDNDPILWTMLNAIKEQQKQIETLQAEIEALKAQSITRR
jgi:hypothetical protein